MEILSRKDGFHAEDCCDLIFKVYDDEEWYQLLALMREHSLHGYETINKVGIPGIARYELMVLDIPTDLAILLKLRMS